MLKLVSSWPVPEADKEVQQKFAGEFWMQLIPTNVPTGSHFVDITNIRQDVFSASWSSYLDLFVLVKDKKPNERQLFCFTSSFAVDEDGSQHGLSSLFRLAFRTLP